VVPGSSPGGPTLKIKQLTQVVDCFFIFHHTDQQLNGQSP
jgi:hypothetical protein